MRRHPSTVHMLTLAFPSPVQHLIDEAHKAASHVTWKMAVAAASVTLLLASGFVIAAYASAVPSCATGESLLVYPKYDRKGIAQHFAYRCGQPHASCGQREKPLGNAPTFDCSPFMLPKGAVSW